MALSPQPDICSFVMYKYNIIRNCVGSQNSQAGRQVFFFFFYLYPINLFCCKTTVLSMFPVLYLTPFMFTKFSSALLFSPARTESQSPDFAIQFSDKRWHLLAPTSAWRVPQSLRWDLCYLSVITNGIIGHKNYAACWKRNNTHAHYRFLR